VVCCLVVQVMRHQQQQSKATFATLLIRLLAYERSPTSAVCIYSVMLHNEEEAQRMCFVVELQVCRFITARFDTGRFAARR